MLLADGPSQMDGNVGEIGEFVGAQQVSDSLARGAVEYESMRAVLMIMISQEDDASIEKAIMEGWICNQQLTFKLDR